MKQKGPSKAEQTRQRTNECTVRLGRMVVELERDYQPEIVTAALNRQVNTRREANRIAEERRSLRRREAELRDRAARL